VLDHIERWTDELCEAVAGNQPLASAVHREPRDLRDFSAPETPDCAETQVGAEEILCLAASDRADDIIARLFAVVLREHGLAARAVARDSRGAALDTRAPPGVVVISALPREGVMSARQLCRRARTHLPEVPVMVGLWHRRADLERSWSRLTAAGATQVSLSFEAGILDVKALLAGRTDPTRVGTSPVAPVSPVPERA
jgi:hypothetical protein